MVKLHDVTQTIRLLIRADSAAAAFVGSSSRSVSACSADYRHIKMSPDRRQRPECGGLESAVGFLAQPPPRPIPIPAASVSFAAGSHPARVRRIHPDIDALMCAPLSRL